MAEFHKYYCDFCREYICGYSPVALAIELNMHNAALHPAEHDGWIGSSIILSAHYAAPAKVSVSSKSEWGDANHPTITKEDRELLKKGYVTWD